MKVLCIRGAKVGDLTYLGNPLQKGFEIYEGEVYSVSGVKVNKDRENSYYLVERPERFSYYCSRFITLSDIDETELIKERELANA